MQHLLTMPRKFDFGSGDGGIPLAESVIQTMPIRLRGGGTLVRRFFLCSWMVWGVNKGLWCLVILGLSLYVLSGGGGSDGLGVVCCVV